ncbi:MAG: hypothetical protein KTR31_17780 [Myxococcales bacterium]|nr:hypothetical protein [Myxococcales bacterium]
MRSSSIATLLAVLLCGCSDGAVSTDGASGVTPVDAPRVVGETELTHGRRVIEARMCVSGAGDVVTTWLAGDERQDAELAARVYGPDGPWGPEMLLFSADGAAPYHDTTCGELGAVSTWNTWDRAGLTQTVWSRRISAAQDSLPAQPLWHVPTDRAPDWPVVGVVDEQVVTAWVDEGGGEVLAATSQDDGQTWGAPVSLGLPPEEGSQAFRLAMTTERASSALVAAAVHDGDRMQLLASHPGGPVRVDDVGPGESLEPWFTSCRDGADAYVAFPVRPGSGHAPVLRVARSATGGASWASSVQVSDDRVVLTGTQQCVVHDGVMHLVADTDTLRGGSEIWLLRVWPDGSYQSHGVPYLRPGFGGSPHIAVDDDRMLVMWMGIRQADVVGYLLVVPAWVDPASTEPVLLASARPSAALRLLVGLEVWQGRAHAVWIEGLTLDTVVHAQFEP